MRLTKIDFSEPFNSVLETLRTLPRMDAEIDEPKLLDITDLAWRKGCDAEVKDALRSLYEAAYGRQVETPSGFIAIAPPVAAFLKETPYYVTTQCEFFLEALTRILAAGSRPQRGTNGSRRPGRKRVANNGRINTHRRSSRRGTQIFPSLTRHRDFRTTNK